jgi:sporulation protein YlmC with PRC-barrel domain
MIRFYEMPGGRIYNSDGRLVATVEVSDLMTQEAQRIMQVLISALKEAFPDGPHTKA